MRTPHFLAGLLLGAFALSTLLTLFVRRVALRWRMVDVPSDRTMHVGAIPRGGGVAISAVILSGIAVLWLSGRVPTPVFLALVVGGAAVAVISWMDDRRGVSSVVRLAVHLAAAAWAVAWLGGLPRILAGDVTLALGAAGHVVGVLWVAWMTNLYNFMDGIDALAGSEAVGVGAAAGALLLVMGYPGLGAAALLLMAAAAGFLVWNWPPARIFMGDVGSATLGFLFGVLALASERAGALPALGWAILLGVFVFDATVTLLRRMARRERLDVPHRSHAYQRAVLGGLGPGSVSALALAVNLVLAVLVAAAVREKVSWAVSAAAATALLAFVYGAVERLRPMYAVDAGRGPGEVQGQGGEPIDPAG